jgi:phage terminase large subunit-like protein
MDYKDLVFLRSELQWRRAARRKQIPANDDWDFYGIKSGRGFGKTLSGAKWIFGKAARDPGSFNFVVAPTHEDLINTCFYGPAGLHGSYKDKATGQIHPVIPPELIIHTTRSPPEIVLWNEAKIQGLSAQEPERLRGRQCSRLWADEIAAWMYPEKAWDNLIFGLRLGDHAQAFWTSTPKPRPFIRMLINLPRSIIISGSTYENADNLSDVVYENIAKYAGTQIGKQEVEGELLDPEDAGFVKRSQWRLWPAKKPLPKFRFVVMSLDTAMTEKTWDRKEQKTDPTACSVWGLFGHDGKDHIMLLDAWEEHLGFPELLRRVKIERSYTYGDADEPVIKPALIMPKGQRPGHQGRPVDLILIEDKGSGISLRQQLAQENVLAHPYNPGKMDKLSRLHAVSLLYPHGRVWCVESAKNPGQPRTWADPLITQVCSFVGEGSLEHDDLLDSATQAQLFLMHKFNMQFTVRADPQAHLAASVERLKQRSNPYDG